jgi:hypothetical protein
LRLHVSTALRVVSSDLDGRNLLAATLEMIMSNTTHHNNCERNREEILAALLVMTIAPNFPTRHVFRLHGITLMPLSR